MYLNLNSKYYNFGLYINISYNPNDISFDLDWNTVLLIEKVLGFSIQTACFQ